MEMELGSSFGKDYKQNTSQDWNCLNNFLTCLQSSQGERVYLGVSEREEAKIPEEVKEMIMNWTEKGYKKPEEKSKKGSSSQNNQDWININPNFQGTEGKEWQKRWIKAGFSYQQTKEWINAGLEVIDFGFATWLKNTKRKTPWLGFKSRQFKPIKRRIRKWTNLWNLGEIYDREKSFTEDKWE